ncbi:MAG: TIGR01212 family radical SAM protein, partial [Nitrospinota bacterium]
MNVKLSPPELRYKTFGSFLKEKFGYPVYKIGIDAGFNCPHRSNSRETGGCTYCNPKSFSSPSADPS